MSSRKNGATKHRSLYISVMLSILFLFVGLFFVACSDSPSSSASAKYELVEGCVFSQHGWELYHIQQDGGWDSLTTACDTVFVVDSFLVYDTLYKDTLVHRYTSFVYGRRNDNSYDTLTALTADSLNAGGECERRVACSLDSVQKNFSCATPSYVCRVYKTQSTVAVVDSRVNFVRCNNRNVLCIRDTFYVDEVAYGTYHKWETTRLNYGKKAWTNYIPWINAPLFDSASFRAALDTLDTQYPTFAMDTLQTGYYITMEGLPDWVTKGTVFKKDSSGRYVVETLRYCPGQCYPSDYEKKAFFFVNGLDKPLERDTVITWMLTYSYSGGSFEGDYDSLTITTLFKSK